MDSINYEIGLSTINYEDMIYLTIRNAVCPNCGQEKKRTNLIDEILD